MKTQKEVTDEILEFWKAGEKENARLWLKLFGILLTKKVYDYLYKQTGIVENEKIPALLFKAQNILGGKIFNQYGIEVDDPRIIKGTPPKFKNQ